MTPVPAKAAKNLKSVAMSEQTIDEKMILGKLNRVHVVELSDFGVYVATADGSKCLCPKSYVSPDMSVGSVVELFIYTDSEDRMVATKERPFVYLGEFGYLEVVDVTQFGAFVNWGILKDLFVPRSAQKTPYKVGEKHIIRVSFDEETHRLVGVGKSKPFINKNTKNIKPFTEVKIIIEEKTPLGFKVIVNDRHEGMIFHNEIFSPVHIGDITKAYIKQIRPDGKLDVSLQPIGEAKEEIGATKILQILDQMGGRMPYNSKTDSILIQKVFGLSKKSFKAGLTQLREKGVLEVREEGTFRV